MSDPSPAASRPVIDAPRLAYLDGLRGWMALFVVFAHLFQTWMLYPPQMDRYGARWLLEAIQWTPLGVMMDGLLAVFVFFAISGIAVTYPILRSAAPGRTLAIMTVYRYPRLTVPSLVSCLIAWMLLSAGLFFNVAVANHHADASALSGFFRFPPDFLGAVQEALWDIYFAPRPAERSWNTVLWTMSAELQGSFMLFLLLAVVRWRGLRLAIAAFLAVYFSAGYFCCFFVGYVLAELLVASERSAAMRRRLLAVAPFGWFCLAAALALAIGLQKFSAGTPRSDYVPHMNVIAAVTMVGVILVAPARAWLSNRASRFLGRISFGLYLTHLLVICSFGCALYIALIDAMPYWLVVAVVGGVTTAVALAVGYVFTLLVEERLLRALKRVIVAWTNRTIDALVGWPAYSLLRSSVLRILP